MTDPRKANLSNRGAGDLEDFTYNIDGVDIVYDATQPGGSAVVGRAVLIQPNRVVRLTADGTAVHGKLILVEADGTCSVQKEGHCELPGGNAATLTEGSKIVGALGAAGARGFIRNVAAATLAEVAVARHTIDDASIATAVLVWLD
jgi:hypothetical protein